MADNLRIDIPIATARSILRNRPLKFALSSHQRSRAAARLRAVTIYVETTTDTLRVATLTMEFDGTDIPLSHKGIVRWLFGRLGHNDEEELMREAVLHIEPMMWLVICD